MLDPTRMDEVLRRGAAVAGAIAEWKGVDAKRRELQAKLDNERAERNAANDSMAKLDKKSAEFASARDRLKELSSSIKSGETALKALEEEASSRLLVIPNAPHKDTPDGARRTLGVRLQRPRVAIGNQLLAGESFRDQPAQTIPYH